VVVTLLVVPPEEMVLFVVDETDADVAPVMEVAPTPDMEEVLFPKVEPEKL
jgi:hypothetical protein